MPEFDPSKPFEKAPHVAPEFDPGKPFKAISSPPTGGADKDQPPDELAAGAFGAANDPLHTTPKDAAEGLSIAGSQIGRNIPVAGPLAVKAGHGLAAFLTRITPDSVLPPELQNKTLGELYSHFDQQDKDTQAKLYHDHPVAANMGAAAGALVTPIPGMGMAGLGGAATRVGGIAGMSAADAAIRGEDPAKAAEIGGGLSAGLEAIPYVGKAAGLLGSKAARALTGVSEEAMARYAADPEAVNAAEKYVKDPLLLKNEIDSTVGKVTGDVDQAKSAADQATAKLGDAKLSARDARGAANQSAQDAFRAAKEGLDKTGAPEGMATNIVDSLNKQGEKLGEMSGQAFDVLDQEGQSFKASELTSAIDRQMRALHIGGVEPAIGPDAAAHGALGQFKGMVEKIAEKAGGADADIPAPVVKQLIQTLDATSKAAYNVNAGELGPEAATNLAKVRASFNDILRDSSPAYAAKMDELAPQVRLVSDMSKVFGNEQKAMAALKAAGSPDTPQGHTVRQMLSRYDEANGTNFVKDLGDYFKAKETLSSPTKLQEFRDSLPESQVAAGTLPEEEAASAAQKQVDDAHRILEEKQAWAEPVSKLGPNSTENVIKSVRGDRNFEAEKQLAHLDETYGTSHLQNVKDAGIANQFSRSSTNGSRKTVLGKAVGTAIGTGLGVMFGGHGGALAGGVVGHGVGAAVGALSDTYGGAAVKAAIDAGIALQNLSGSKFLAPIMQAAQRGPKELAVTHYLMSQQDPEYQKLMNQKNAE